ncbi:hypothetical protein [Streptomyces jumonjinensis]|uniref:hypothetical protein n=1 Tax=Streptomyces jumonjinensis TaxID=1945 RepID=UPI0037A39F78
MEIQSLQDLLEPDGRTLAFTPWGLGRMAPEDAVRFQQEQMAHCELIPEVAEEVHRSFGKLRALFVRGVLDFDAYAHVVTQAALIPEGALRERFVQWCEGEATFEDASACRPPRTLPVGSQDDVRRLAKRLPSGRGDTRSRWMLRVGGELIGFDGMLSSLMCWARTVGLLRGQRARAYEKRLRDCRNRVAHSSGFHGSSPVEAARELCDLAEFINQLWGQPTPGGRQYPAPVRREVAVISWNDTGSVSLGAAAALHEDRETEGRSHVLIRTASLPGARPEDPHWMDFDTLYETTYYPTGYLWGPGTRSEALAWLDREQPEGDFADYMDRVFMVRVHDDRLHPPMRPEVAAGLNGTETEGVWHTLRADFPLDAFNHARGLQDPASKHTPGQGECPTCPVRVLASGAHSEALAAAETALGAIAPVRPAEAGVPHPLHWSRP